MEIARGGSSEGVSGVHQFPRERGFDLLLSSLDERPRRYHMIRAVIFDMDGVIVDSEWLHQTVEIETLNEAGLEITRDDLLEYTGMPLMDVLEGLKNEHEATFDPELVAARKRDRYLERVDELEPIDGAVDTVRSIGAEYRTALASSSHRKAVDAVVDMLDLAAVFDTTISFDDVRVGKPDPETFERAADRLDVAPESAVVVEDSRNGVEAAQEGGFHAVGFRSASEIDLSAAEYVSESMDEVERYVKRIDTSN